MVMNVELNRTKLERNEAIVGSRFANVIDDKMNRLKQVYDPRVWEERRGPYRIARARR